MKVALSCAAQERGDRLEQACARPQSTVFIHGKMKGACLQDSCHSKPTRDNMIRSAFESKSVSKRWHSFRSIGSIRSVGCWRSHFR